DENRLWRVDEDYVASHLSNDKLHWRAFAFAFALVARPVVDNLVVSGLLDPYDLESLVHEHIARHRQRVARFDEERFLRPVSLRRSEEHTSELQSRVDVVCRLLLENKYSMQNLIISDISDD